MTKTTGSIYFKVDTNMDNWLCFLFFQEKLD